MNKIAMHVSMASSVPGTPYMKGRAFRHKVDGMPQDQDAFIIDVRSGTPRKALWKIKLGREFLSGEYETAEQAFDALNVHIWANIKLG
jgi:hypothetical protein